MSQKQFILLADVLRQNKPAYNHDFAMAQWRRMVDALADFCQSQNPRFIRELWLSYIDGRCGPKGGPR